MISDLGVTLFAMSAILALWSVAVLLMIGIGAPVGRALGLSSSTRLSTLLWLGVTVTVGWLFLVHLVTPLDSIVARLPLVAAGGGRLVDALPKRRPGSAQGRAFGPNL